MRSVVCLAGLRTERRAQAKSSKSRINPGKWNNNIWKFLLQVFSLENVISWKFALEYTRISLESKQYFPTEQYLDS